MIDGNDIWEALFGILKGNVPDEMTEDVCQQLADCLTAEQANAAEIERLRERLELTGEFADGPDGIECRDDTIKLLDERIARQSTTIAELTALLREARLGFSGIESLPRHSRHDDAENISMMQDRARREMARIDTILNKKDAPHDEGKPS